MLRKAVLSGDGLRSVLRLPRLGIINPPAGHPAAPEIHGAPIVKFGFDMGSHSD
ncbi:hypothetical protein RLEG12_31800 [Rhizobium leguminosarum bv. trifolii CB782]|nr:hypothetical protein RLEG12_31800 [Rhizobium leguminosarum bv. trifolii CB782]